MERSVKTNLYLLCLLVPIFATAAPVTSGNNPPEANVINFNQLAKQCAPSVHHDTLQAIARIESGFNPYAIGVVKGALKKQPRTYAEAVAAAKFLHAQNKNFSMGLVQVNKKNLPHYGLNYETVFDPCKNLAAGAKILTDCFTRADNGRMSQSALQKSFSCYYSGNFQFGFTRDFSGQPSYVQKVVNSAALNSENTTLRVPAINPRANIISKPTRQLTRPYLQPAVAKFRENESSSSSAEEPVQSQRVYQHWDAFKEL